MKSFVTSLVLLGLLLAGIAANYLYINHVADEMNARLDRLPQLADDTCAEQVASLCDFWEGHADTVGLSVDYKTLDRVSEQCVSLQACSACGDRYGYRLALSLLRDAVGDMRRLERFSIGNLLVCRIG